MRYNRCGRSGIQLPAVSLGLWHNFGGVDALENARLIMRSAFDAGITHFDLANNYGPPPGFAEENFGRILKKDFSSYHDELIISTKAGYECGPDRTAIGDHVNILSPVSIRAFSAWVWNMSIFFITIAPIRKPL